MSVPAQPALLGVAVVTLVLLAVLVAVLAVLAVRRARRRQAALDALLERSRSQVDSLSARVEQLSAEVGAGRAADQRDHERGYVITTLADGTPGSPAPVTLPDARPVPPLRRLEELLVAGVAARAEQTGLGARAVDAVVGVVALGHGVRRALSAENRDRAAAEAHLARRRSRRTRRHEVREARRVLRAVRAVPGGDRDAA